MWEAYGFENEDFLWAGIPFLGGISGNQSAPCGSISTAAICLGLRHRSPLADKTQAKAGRDKARDEAGSLVQEFTRTFGDITCRGLLKIDFTKPGAYQHFRESGVWKDTCEKYLMFIIDKLYDFEDKRKVTLPVV
jgi:hypothetical protein